MLTSSARDGRLRLSERPLGRRTHESNVAEDDRPHSSRVARARILLRLERYRSSMAATGSVEGLLRFADIAEEYSKTRSFAAISEHEHLRSTYVLGTDDVAQSRNRRPLDHGSQQDIARLAKLVRAKLRGAKPGDQIVIAREYDSSVEYSIILNIREASFDPASEDPQLVDA